jgi:hypothetical protein
MLLFKNSHLIYTILIVLLITNGIKAQNGINATTLYK